MKNSIFYILLNVSLIISTSCSSEDNMSEGSDSFPKEFRLSFLKENNPLLQEDFYVTFSKDSLIDLFIPNLETDNLIASFDDDHYMLEVGGAKQKSGVSANNFNYPIEYVITEKGKTMNHAYTLYLRGWNGLPVVDISIEGAQEVYSKEEYLSSTIKIYNAPAYGVIVDSVCKIKGRGHGTWKGNKDDGKKPYQIKFNKRTSVCSFPACKKWVLLSVPVDKSFLRTPFMFEVGKALNMDYIPNYQYVDLYVNNIYRGLYLLTDKIEVDKNRITDVDSDGFLIERDNNFLEETLCFRSDSHFLNFFTFKYPDPDNGEIKLDDDNYNYIKDLIINMENSFLDIPDGDYNRYRKYIDVESFVRWYVASQLLSSDDPNFYYLLKNRESKLKMVTLWDADWCLANGMQVNGKWLSPPEEVNPTYILYWHYFQYLTKDKYFNELVLEEWNKLKPSLPTIKDKMMQLKLSLEYAQKDNFKIWKVLGEYLKPGLTNFSTWEEEVNYVFDFWGKRIDCLDTHFKEIVLMQ